MFQEWRYWAYVVGLLPKKVPPSWSLGPPTTTIDVPLSTHPAYLPSYFW